MIKYAKPIIYLLNVVSRTNAGSPDVFVTMRLATSCGSRSVTEYVCTTVPVSCVYKVVVNGRFRKNGAFAEIRDKVKNQIKTFKILNMQSERAYTVCSSIKIFWMRFGIYSL